MSAPVILIVGYSLIVGACVFAWWQGGAPERWGGTLNLAVNLLGALTYLLPASSRQTGVLIIDGLLAFGLLLLAVRFASLWIGVAMMLQAAQFILHTYYYVMELRHDLLFAVVNNLVLLGVILCIITGTAIAWLRRSRAAVVA